MRIIFILLLTTITYVTFSQTSTKEYSSLVEKAELLFKQKEFLTAARVFESAFESVGNKGMVKHRYAAAACWALSDKPDSAFNQLFRIVSKGKYANYEELLKDSNFQKLYNNPKWQLLIDKMKKNREEFEKFKDQIDVQ